MDKFPASSPFAKGLVGASALLTYEPYYGLKEKPFSLSTDPRFLYRSAEHSRTFDDLLLGIRRREGLIVLTGDIGTGKTTLCRAVLEKLDRKTFSTFVPDPFITREDLLKRLLIDFGVMSVDDLTSGRMTGSSPSDLSYPLYEFLKSLVPLQAFAVLVIDETQNLALPLLEEIRILSDLEAPEKLLQVVLVGQLELGAKLKLPEMRQLDQRVTARCRLQGLTREGVSGYIAHRLEVAGGTEDRVHFAPAAIDAIFRASGGVPRVINLICDRALYLSYLQRRNEIDVDVVKRSIDDLGVGHLTAAPSSIESQAGPDVAREPAALAPVIPIQKVDPLLVRVDRLFTADRSADLSLKTLDQLFVAQPAPGTEHPLTLTPKQPLEVEHPLEGVTELKTELEAAHTLNVVEPLKTEQLLEAERSLDTKHPIDAQPIKGETPPELEEPRKTEQLLKGHAVEVAPPLKADEPLTSERLPEIDLATKVEQPLAAGPITVDPLPPPLEPQTKPVQPSKLDELLTPKSPVAAATAQQGVVADLSGLDVLDIPDDLSAPMAQPLPPEAETGQNPILALRARANRDLLDHSTSALRWKRRALRVAATVAIVLTLFGFVVLGELVLMTYYPDPALVEISWPAAPRPPRMAQLPTAVEPPDDLPADLSVGPRTSLPRAPAKAE